MDETQNHFCLIVLKSLVKFHVTTCGNLNKFGHTTLTSVYHFPTKLLLSLSPPSYRSSAPSNKNHVACLYTARKKSSTRLFAVDVCWEFNDFNFCPPIPPANKCEWIEKIFAEPLKALSARPQDLLTTLVCFLPESETKCAHSVTITILLNFELAFLRTVIGPRKLSPRSSMWTLIGCVMCGRLSLFKFEWLRRNETDHYNVI